MKKNSDQKKNMDVLSWNNDRSLNNSFYKSDKDQYDFEEYQQHKSIQKQNFPNYKSHNHLDPMFRSNKRLPKTPQKIILKKVMRR